MAPKMEVGFTDTQRTRESARNYVKGILNLTLEEDVELPPAIKDLVRLFTWIDFNDY